MMHFNKNLFDMKAGLCNPGKARQGKARQGTTLETLLGPEPPEPAVCSSKFLNQNVTQLCLTYQLCAVVKTKLFCRR